MFIICALVQRQVAHSALSQTGKNKKRTTSDTSRDAERKKKNFPASSSMIQPAAIPGKLCRP